MSKHDVFVIHLSWSALRIEKIRGQGRNGGGDAKGGHGLTQLGRRGWGYGWVESEDEDRDRDRMRTYSGTGDSDQETVKGIRTGMGKGARAGAVNS